MKRSILFSPRRFDIKIRLYHQHSHLEKFNLLLFTFFRRFIPLFMLNYLFWGLFHIPFCYFILKCFHFFIFFIIQIDFSHLDHFSHGVIFEIFSKYFFSFFLNLCQNIRFIIRKTKYFNRNIYKPYPRKCQETVNENFVFDKNACKLHRIRNQVSH